MPPFYKHRSDPSPGEISYPWRKIDEDQLRHYISGKPLPDWQCQAHYQCHRLTTSRNVATASLTFHSLLVKTLAKLRASSSDWNCWNILLGWRCWPMIRKRRVWYRHIWQFQKEHLIHDSIMSNSLVFFLRLTNWLRPAAICGLLYWTHCLEHVSRSRTGVFVCVSV